MPRQRFEDFQFVGRRRADRLHRRVLEVGDDPLVVGEHDVLVGPLEVEGEADRFADARVLELFAAGVEIPALRAGRRAVVQRLLLHPSLVEGGEIVAVGPDARGVLLVEVDRAGLERLEGDLPLAVILEAQAAEIVLADVDRQVLGPIVVAQFVFDAAPLLQRLDLVGARAERRVRASRRRSRAPSTRRRRTPACRRRPDGRRGVRSLTKRTSTTSSASASTPSTSTSNCE